MNWVRRLLLATGLAELFGARSASAGILADVTVAADNGARALQALGYSADYSFDSIREIERFMKENVNSDGGAKEDGELASQIGGKLFLLGAYLGECLRRHLNWKWEGDDSDPEATINVSVSDPNGDGKFWPIQRIIKRVQEGEENDLWAYANAILLEK